MVANRFGISTKHSNIELLVQVLAKLMSHNGTNKRKENQTVVRESGQNKARESQMEIKTFAIHRITQEANSNLRY